MLRCSRYSKFILICSNSLKTSSSASASSVPSRKQTAFTISRTVNIWCWSLTNTLEVLSKQEVKKFLKNGIFRKGTTLADIEQKALYVTL